MLLARASRRDFEFGCGLTKSICVSLEDCSENVCVKSSKNDAKPHQAPQATHENISIDVYIYISLIFLYGH